MFSKVLVLALAAAPLVAAHGRVDVITGDAGGNTTALGIQGAVVPLTGKNKVTEVDTTVFNSRQPASDGLGKTTDTGKIKAADVNTLMTAATAQAGTTLPQVNSTMSGTWHVVTSDGFGQVFAVLDPTATGSFANGVPLTTTLDVPGNNGNPPKGNNKYKKSVLRRLAEGTGVIAKRATNINEDFPMEFSVPAGTTCTGTVGAQSNVCLVKIANKNGAGPFGGVVAIQMAGAAAPAAAAGAAAAPAAAAGSAGTVTAGSAAAAKERREFVA
ncbi:hypothetical protein Daus18300_011324 [Diaporthe australafricana]|uniref:Cas1 appressorium specific protein n=1 Tax=Diaporthe australafricana TaxID=127596 RepID=A0ABR3W6U3_9PEZI